MQCNAALLFDYESNAIDFARHMCYSYRRSAVLRNMTRTLCAAPDPTPTTPLTRIAANSAYVVTAPSAYATTAPLLMPSSPPPLMLSSPPRRKLSPDPPPMTAPLPMLSPPPGPVFHVITASVHVNFATCANSAS